MFCGEGFQGLHTEAADDVLQQGESWLCLCSFLLRARVEQDAMAPIRIRLSAAVHFHLVASVPQPPAQITSPLSRDGWHLRLKLFPFILLNYFSYEHMHL